MSQSASNHIKTFTSRDYLAKRNEGNRFVIHNNGSPVWWGITSPLYFTTSMKPGEVLSEIGHMGQLTVVYAKPIEAAKG